MTGFDILVYILVGATAIAGYSRGLVQEVLALAAWVMALAAIHYLHAPLAQALIPYTGEGLGKAGVLSFALLMLVPYVIIKMLAKRMGQLSRDSVLGPIDRVLGVGFGVVKGMILVVLGFSVLALGYDTVWGAAGRPVWMTQSRTYPFVDAASESLVKMLGERRDEAAKAKSRKPAS